MLVLDNVHSYYETSHILQGVSLSVPKGKCCSLIGRNGAGKTTTIHSIAGLINPSKGSITFNNENINNFSSYQIARKGVGLVPQGRRVFPSLTVKENLTMSARTHKTTHNHKDSWNLKEVYELFPILNEKEDCMGNELSGGQQQMLSIGRALMTNPDLILLDEPSEGLAPVIINQIKEKIYELKKSGLSILMVEQNIPLACEVSDLILIMNKGKIVWQGTAKALIQNEELQQKYLGLGTEKTNEQN